MFWKEPPTNLDIICSTRTFVATTRSISVRIIGKINGNIPIGEMGCGYCLVLI